MTYTMHNVGEDQNKWQVRDEKDQEYMVFHASKQHAYRVLAALQQLDRWSEFAFQVVKTRRRALDSQKEPVVITQYEAVDTTFPHKHIIARTADPDIANALADYFSSVHDIRNLGLFITDYGRLFIGRVEEKHPYSALIFSGTSVDIERAWSVLSIFEITTKGVFTRDTGAGKMWFSMEHSREEELARLRVNHEDLKEELALLQHEAETLKKKAKDAEKTGDNAKFTLRLLVLLLFIGFFMFCFVPR